MALNQDQKTYLIKQIRDHANWTLSNTKLTIPMEYTETEIAHALNDAGFVIEARPITDVSLPPTPEMEANRSLFADYLEKVNGLTGVYVDAIISGEKDNPASILQEFIRDLAAVEM